MRKNFTLLAAILSIFFFACQKEADLQGVSSNGTNGNSGIDLSGTWKFINFRAKTLATNEVVTGSYSLKTVTTSDYTSENNTGTVVFDAGNMSYDNLSYSINAIAHATTYENGAIVDTISIPLQVAIQPAKGQATFTLVGSDSLYFKNGGFTMGGASQTSKPSGAKINREQDKLYLTQNVAETKNTVSQGQTIKSSQVVEVVTEFQKQ